jgi:cytochrome c oxidase cbb3-type subunit 4
MIDVNDLRSAVTVLSFLCFAGIVAWAWARSRRDDLEACGQIPFLSGEEEQS